MGESINNRGLFKCVCVYMYLCAYTCVHAHVCFLECEVSNLGLRVASELRVVSSFLTLPYLQVQNSKCSEKFKCFSQLIWRQKLA